MTNSRSTSKIQQLTTRVKMLEDITHSMAHNSRGAAAGIKMMNEFLQEKAKAGFKDRENESLTTQEILGCIAKSADSLLRTLHEMMEVVNQDLGSDLQYADCDIKKISDGVVAQLCSSVIQKRAKIIFKFAVRRLTYAKTYLESLLYNLISNALKYSKPDVEPQIVVSLNIIEGQTVLAVADNGLGIDMAKYGDKLFGLNQTFHAGYDSKGIGLFITKRQIESLGGKIDVESELGKGTKFIVTL